MKYSTETAEFRLLLLAVRLNDGGDAIMQAEEIINGKDIDWDDLLQRAELHRIRPQLEDLLKRVGTAKAPDEVMERLADANRENLLRQLRNAAEFFRVKQYLDSMNIQAVPYKGFWLGHSVYGNLAARESGDVDLYIHEEDLDKVIVLMPDLGYRAETSAHPRFIRKIKKVSAEYNFDKYEGDTCIIHMEFHWKTGSAHLGMDISYDDLASQIVTGTLEGQEFQVLTPTGNMLLTLMHHGGKDPLTQLKHILDIGMLLKKKDAIDWEWVIRMAKQYNIEKLLYVAVSLASFLTGTEIPGQIEADAGAVRMRKMAEERFMMMSVSPERWDKGWSDFKNLAFHLRSRTGLTLKARMIAESCRSWVIKAFTPERLLRIYLKRRYQIDRVKI